MSTGCSQGFDGRRFRIGWDAGNGAAGPALEKLAAQLPGEHHLLFTDVDGRFPNHHPDPTEEKNLEDLKRAGARRRASTSASPSTATATGSARSTAQGRVIWGDQLLVDPRRAGARRTCPARRSSPTSRRARRCSTAIAELGGKPLMWKTGHSLIKSKMKETGAPLAGEMSGHIFFAHEYYGFDDALYAAVRLIRAVGRARQAR